MKRAGLRRALDAVGGAGSMIAIMATMLFLTVLAAATGLGLHAAGQQLSRQLAGRLTVQIVEGDPARRDAAAARALAVLRARPEVASATPADRAALAKMLRPWLGDEADGGTLPIPALIDVVLHADGSVDAVSRAVIGAVPAARVDRHERWMSPVSGLMRTMVVVAASVVGLIGVATAAVTVIAARAGLAMHGATIEVLHMLGSTDREIARLFQRSIAVQVGIGGLAGFAAAALVILVVGAQVAAIGSDLLGGIVLGPGDWLVLTFIPAGFVLLAIVAARFAVLARLGRMP